MGCNMCSDLELMDDNVIISRALAVKIGINEAILLQEIHRQAMQTTEKHEGHRWIRKSTKEWQSDIPFMSLSTIKRTISSLKERKLIRSTSVLNSDLADRTNWYRVNYSELKQLITKIDA